MTRIRSSDKSQDSESESESKSKSESESKSQVTWPESPSVIKTQSRAQFDAMKRISLPLARFILSS